MAAGSDPKIDLLIIEFENDLRQTFADAKRLCKYNATYLLEMLGQYGGLETAQRLLATSGVQSGLTELWMCGHLDLSVEAKVLLSKYRPLLYETLLQVARDRLRQYGPPGEALINKK